MKALLIKALLKIVQMLTSETVMSFIKEQFIYMISSTKTGAEKRETVIANVKKRFPDIKSHLIGLAIEALVAKQKL